MLDDIQQKIDEAYNAEGSEEARSYIGASGIGSKCDAELAFSLRGFPNNQIDPQLKRIFRAGHQAERWVLKDLAKAGLNVIPNDPMTGKQWAYEDFGGHIAMHTDGFVEENDETSLLEIKSMNDRAWVKCEKEGVKYSHRHYYDQIQFMLGYAEIEKCLFVSYNKNTSKYLAEVIEYDEFYFQGLQERAYRILRNEAAKVATDKSDWRCKGCFKRSVCWDNPNLEWKQRFCQYAEPLKDGSWTCGKGISPCTSQCDQFQRYRPREK